MTNHRKSIRGAAASASSGKLIGGVLGAVCVAVLAAPPARAQNSSYSNYLRQTAAIERSATASTNAALRSISQGIARDQQYIDAILRQYVSQNYARLMRQYRTSGAYRSESFKQFAEQELQTHATIKPDTSAFDAGQARHRAQVERFAGMQDRAKAQRETGESLIHNMETNSNRRLATIDNADQIAIRGNSSYVDTRSGNAQWLPTYAPGTHQATDGSTYHQDPNGYWSVQQGSSWLAMPSR